jgi:Ca2+-dependent lipid-binding protein
VRPSRIQAFEISRFTLGKRAPFITSARIITRMP